MQQTLDVGAETKSKGKARAKKQPFPKTLRARAQAVHRALAAHEQPATAADLARQFSRARVKQIEELLGTMEALGLARQTESGAYTI